MKKISILLIALMLSSLAVSYAADDTAIGFKFGTGVLLPLSNYNMKAENMFALNLILTDELTVCLIREEGRIRGDKSYTDPANVKYTIVNQGNIAITGLRIMHSIPFPVLNFNAGLDLGTARFTTTNNFRRDNGTAGVAADWGLGAADPLAGSHPVMGLVADLILVSKETKTLKTELFASFGARIIDLPETFALGQQEANAANTPAIDPVTNFNNFNLLVGLNIGF